MLKLKTLAILLLGAGLLAACGSTQQAARSATPTATAADSAATAKPPTPPRRPGQSGSDIKPYKEVITEDAKSDEGLFHVHTIDDKLFYEIPNDLLDTEMLLVTRVARTATNLGYGGDKFNTQVVRWQRHNKQILLRIVGYSNVADPDKPIYEAVRNANFEPVIKSFKIEAYNEDTTGVVIDVSSLFTSDVPVLGMANSRRQGFRVRRLDTSRSFITSAKSYPRNIEVRHVLTYDATQPPANSTTSSISLEMNQSMIVLPEEPMQPRMWDERVGYFSVQMTNYGLDAQRAENQRFITRWRLEPKDPAAYARGELVEPVKPIVYYIDPATPEKWRPYLKQGVEDWNVAFEQAGFRNAIMAKDPPTPEEDPEFSPEDIRYSVIRYLPSNIANAQGPHVHDPRTGEILESDIRWFHNVMNLLRNWFFVQTAAVNPEAQSVKFRDDIMGRLVRFVSAHEVGHTLGLPHNMKASSSYPVDSLRSATFTQRMGTAPSIMDYARFNYVAQPGDEGVSLMPNVGVYDKYAIEWGYRVVPNAGSAEAEQPTLHQWIRDHEDDPMYRFGDPSSIDPGSQTEDLGDDGVKASTYGIANLKRILPNLHRWTYRAGEDFADLNELYGQVLGQWNRYMGHVATIIGGVDRTRKTYDQDGYTYNMVPKAKQHEAMNFLIREAFDTPMWMIDENILRRIEHAGIVERVRGSQVRTLNRVLDLSRLQRLIEGEVRYGDEAYSAIELLGDVREAVWREVQNNQTIDTYRRNLQRGYLERMEYLLTTELTPIPAQFRAFVTRTEVDASQSDIRMLARGELQTLKTSLQRTARRTRDRMTRLHLEDCIIRIDKILDHDED